jgi:hypothetical protein
MGTCHYYCDNCDSVHPEWDACDPKCRTCKSSVGEYDSKGNVIDECDDCKNYNNYKLKKDK